MLVNEMFVGPQLLKRKAGVASSKIQIFEHNSFLLPLWKSAHLLAQVWYLLEKLEHSPAFLYFSGVAH